MLFFIQRVGGRVSPPGFYFIKPLISEPIRFRHQFTVCQRVKPTVLLFRHRCQYRFVPQQVVDHRLVQPPVQVRLAVIGNLRIFAAFRGFFVVNLRRLMGVNNVGRIEQRLSVLHRQNLPEHGRFRFFAVCLRVVCRRIVRILFGNRRILIVRIPSHDDILIPALRIPPTQAAIVIRRAVVFRQFRIGGGQQATAEKENQDQEPGKCFLVHIQTHLSFMNPHTFYIRCRLKPQTAGQGLAAFAALDDASWRAIR